MQIQLRRRPFVLGLVLGLVVVSIWYFEHQKSAPALLPGSSEVQVVARADQSKGQNPEVFFGALRNDLMGNGVSLAGGEQALRLPEKTEPNKFYLEGLWKFTPEFAMNDSAAARIIFSFQAKDVYLVASADQPLEVKVLVDGKEVAHPGADVQGGKVSIQEGRLYHLVGGTDYQPHRLELVVEKPGLKAYTLTFG